VTTLLWLTIALPLIGAAILLLGGRATDAWGHLLSCATVIGSFLCGAVLFTHLLGRPAEDRLVHETLFSWVPVATLRVDFGLQLDALSMCFVLLITGVGGTGVLTVSALLGMAAHLDGSHVTVLDQMGMAQKGGSVFSHIRLAAAAEQLHGLRVGRGEADLPQP
jgi:NADH:ubiquinone oxidoreductase subunit 4 (subunit M)